VREPVDALLRAALQRHGPGYAVICGQGPARLAAALAALQPATTPPAEGVTAALRWHGVCDRCGEPDCERHLLPRGY
jgi:hypothetical protein